MLFLNVPFAEKDAAKALGARWNPDKKKWHVQNKQDYPKFQKWILEKNEDECMILCDYYYIVTGVHTCFKCRKCTTVVGFGIENYYTFYQEGIFEGDPEPEYSFGEIHIASWIEPLSDKLLYYLKNKYNYYYGYSKFTNSSYYGNHCMSCGVLQGDFYIFSEVDSPFFIDSAESAKALRLFRVPLSADLKVICDVGYGSEDYLLKAHAQIIDFQEIPAL